MPRLIVSLPDGTEVTHELTDETVTVGRVSDNMIQIEDASVSSHHAELTLRGGDYILKDLGSTNGTRLNGTAIAPDEEHPLRPGTSLTFGSIPIRYASDEGGEEPMPEESEPALAPAATSIAPSDFTNASPFQKKKKEKDTSAAIVIAIGILAILAAAGAILLVMSMQPPQL